MVSMDLDASRRSIASTETAGPGLNRWPSAKTAIQAWSWWRLRTTDLYCTRDRWRNTWKVTRRTSWYWRWRTGIHCCVWTSAAERQNWRSTGVTDMEMWDRTNWVMGAGTAWIFSRLARCVFVPDMFLLTWWLAQRSCYHLHIPSTCDTGWLRGTVVERRSVTGELSLSYARPAADGWPLMWVNRPLQGQPTRPTQPFILFAFWDRSINE